MTEEIKKYIIEHFSDTKNIDLAEYAGCSVATISRFAKKHKLKKTEEFMRDCIANASRHAVLMTKGKKRPKGWRIPNSELYQFKKGEQWANFDEEKKAEIVKRITATRKETIKSERRRMLYGLPQQTNLRLSCLPKKVQRSRSHIRYTLRNKGYRVEKGSLKAYYSAETKRSSCEDKYTKQGFKFYSE